MTREERLAYELGLAQGECSALRSQLGAVEGARQQAEAQAVALTRELDETREEIVDMTNTAEGIENLVGCDTSAGEDLFLAVSAFVAKLTAARDEALAQCEGFIGVDAERANAIVARDKVLDERDEMVEEIDRHSRGESRAIEARDEATRRAERLEVEVATLREALDTLAGSRARAERALVLADAIIRDRFIVANDYDMDALAAYRDAKDSV